MKWLTLSFFCLLSFVINAQEVKFYSSADAKQIIAGNYFEVTFTLENAKGQSFQAPSFLNFDLIAGPNQSTQMSIINGRTSQKVSYGYVLSSSKPGKYTIGPASIRISGTEYKTKPIDIEVLKSDERAAANQTNGDGKNILELELDFDTAYIGQQLTLRYVLLTTEDVRSYDFVSPPEFDGFYTQAIQRFNARPERVIRDGVQYVSRVLQVYALYPQQKGLFAIDPAVVDLGISTPGSRNSFFFNTKLRPVRLISEPTSIRVIDLPDGAPKSFCGAVGDFYMGTAVDKKSLTMEDAVTLTLQVKGFGDPKFIEPPKQNFGDDFEIYEPNLINEQIEQQGDKVELVKTYEYLLLPKRTGEIRFRPEMTFFKTDSSKYEKIIGQLYTVNVIKGTDRQSADLISQSVELPPIYATTNLRSASVPFLGSIGYWALNGFTLLGFIGLFVAKSIKDKKDAVDIKDVRQIKAFKIADKQLANAQSALNQGDTKAYYVELRKVIMQYLADKLKLDTTQMSKTDIQQLMTEKGLESSIAPLMKLLERGEQAIYASVAPDNAEIDYQLAREVISQIELSYIK